MNKWLIIGITAFTFLIIAAALVLSGGGVSPAVVQKTAGAKISINHTQKDLGTIKLHGGLVYHNFPIQNTGTKDLQIANIATSCHCTRAFLKVGNSEGPYFSMKGMSGPSNWTGILKPGEKADIVSVYDPSVHGLEGLGAISRIISFETNDPDNPYVELTFNATEVNE